ncbi:MAG TPA: hypothetical protein VHG32_10490 [Thermoanaerobaculia bacterium]|jgi:hypothetical protein|nr:hypothetical protein [Thermoanaerobaculia bacterium]
MDQIVNYVTCFAAVGLFIATCALVGVTVHHARSAEKLAAAAHDLGLILRAQGTALAKVAELNALVNALAADHVVKGGPRFSELASIINRLYPAWLDGTER